MRAGKTARFLHRRTHFHRPDGQHLFTGSTVNPHIAEAVVGKLRAEPSGSLSADHPVLLILVAAKNIAEEIALGIQGFAVVQTDLPPGRTAHFQFHHTGQTTAEIDHQFSSGRRKQRHGFQSVPHRNGFCGLEHRFMIGGIHRLTMPPGSFRRVHIPFFTHHQVGIADMGGSGQELPVGTDFFHSVAVIQLQPGQEAQPVTVLTAVAGQADPADPPTVSQQHTEGILPFPQQTGQIVDLIVQHGFVRRGFGRKTAGIHTGPVEPQGVHTMGGGAEHCLFRKSLHLKHPAELLHRLQPLMASKVVGHGHKLFKKLNFPFLYGGLLLRLDPSGFPGSAHETGKNGHLAFGGEFSRENLGPQTIAAAGLQRQSGQLKMRLPGQHAALPKHRVPPEQGKAHFFHRPLHIQGTTQQGAVRGGGLTSSVYLKTDYFDHSKLLPVQSYR